MKKLFIKICIYAFLLLIVLEVWVRILHLHKDYPNRFVDEYKVEKWVPNQNGHSVTGNRRQNFTEYKINDAGYNSYREFKPSKEKVELALVGDSFIEGFHQHYYNSIGTKIENKIEGLEVYEYGYAGYDFADQLHLIYQYKDQFELIDFVILGLKFENDLTRGEYNVVTDRIQLDSPINRLIKKSMLLVYMKNIGATDPVQEMIIKIISTIKGGQKLTTSANKEQKGEDVYDTYFSNFKSLVLRYGYDKEKFALLLNAETTPNRFLTYLKENNFKYIDFSQRLNNSKQPTTLIYDRHWNNHGRTLIAEEIVNYLPNN